MVEPAADFSSFQDSVFSDLMSSVKTASAIAASDVGFLRSSESEFAPALDAANARILALTNKLLLNAASGSDITAPKLVESDDVEYKWGDVVEVVDYLLEKADTCLDEYTGAITRKNPEPGPNARPERTPRLQHKFRSQPSWKSKNLSKPQLKFKVKPDNMDESPFRPLLTAKPHAIVPLQDSFQPYTNEDGREQYRHPYEKEIMSMEYPESMFQTREPIDYLPFEDTTATLVDTPEALVAMLQDLKAAKEIAIDLEHHDQRSYVGFTCLMQVSTREKDWIVDTLQLRSELQILNDVFADPSIVKVLHGANMDIIWLQRDFGLYIVGLFDTYHAARSLGLAGHGLAFLLKKYVDFDADKQYQLADWRLRPLPEEMFNYARSDTHFLLYCFDLMRNELLTRSDITDPEKNKMQHVLQNSKEVALRTYEKERYDAENGDGPLGWRNILFRGDNLDTMQAAVFKAVHSWRDRVAREEDESLHYVMPRHHMFNLARQMPMDAPGLLTACVPTSQPVRLRASDLAMVIKRSKEAYVQEREAKERGAAAPNPTKKRLGSTDVDVFDASVDPSKTRMQVSSFWGAVDESSRWQAPHKSYLASTEDFRLAIPLPQLTAAVYVSTDATPRPLVQSSDPGALVEHEYVKNRGEKKKENDILVVRSLGGGRKRKSEEVSKEDLAQSANPDTQQTLPTEKAPVDTPTEIEAEVARAAQASNAPDSDEGLSKKERKRRKKEARQDAQSNGAGDKPPQPFDYASAPSLLDSSKDPADKSKSKSKSKKKKAFDPYALSSDAPRGLGRAYREKSGKSKTFKS